jgi:hypothetical protein
MEEQTILRSLFMKLISTKPYSSLREFFHYIDNEMLPLYDIHNKPGLTWGEYCWKYTDEDEYTFLIRIRASCPPIFYDKNSMEKQFVDFCMEYLPFTKYKYDRILIQKLTTKIEMLL